MSLKLDGERLCRDGYKAYAHPILIVIFIAKGCLPLGNFFLS